MSNLYDHLKAAQERVFDLQEKYNLLKEGEMKEWESKIEKAPMAELQQIAEAYQEWEVSSGLAVLKAQLEEARNEYSAAVREYDDMVEKRNVRKEKRQIKESGLSEAEWRARQAVNEYGYTTDWRDAGYLLKDGNLLNFTGEKGKHYGTRGLDHRNIGVLYASRKYQDFAAMVAFMNEGNIRVMFESPGIDIIAEPTMRQIATIRDMVRASMTRNCFYVDFTDEKGKTVKSLTYEGTLRPERIVNDIRDFFAEKKAVPCFA